ncbi:hypothetical protein [Oleisolibacter albus]|nr:hypothetical protein [Oleisolibacter albus]
MSPEHPIDTDMHRRRRGKNLAVLAVLLFLVALIYVVAMVRMSGGALP